MPQIINTNLASLTAQRNLNTSQASGQKALERLSSGLRINSARDDAAGLAISTRFTAQVKGLNVAIRNAGDGISLAQTAEGALGAVTDSLQRIRELALQSSNATNSDSDRQALNAEAQQLIDEISRVSEQTNFNGRKLLDGSFQASVQIGTNAGETVAFGVGKITADRLGGGVTAGVSAIGTDNGIANGDLIINGVAIGPSKSADDTASTTNRAASAIAKAAAINRSSAETGVVAQVNENRVAGTSQVAAALTGSISLNGVSIAVGTSGVNTSADRQSVVSAINSRSDQTGVVAVDTGNDSAGVELVAADGRNVTLSFNTVTAAATGLAAAGTYEGGFTLTSVDGGAVTIVEGGDGTGNGNLSNAGLVAGTYDSSSASVSSVARTAVTAGTASAGTSTFSISGPIDIISASTSASLTGTGALTRTNFANSAEAEATVTATGAPATFNFGQGATVATLTATGAGSTYDFATTNVSFTISDGTTTSSVSLTTDQTDLATLVTTLNGQFTTDGTNITAQDDGSGNLEFVSTASGASAEITIAGLGAGETTALGAGIVDGTTNGTDSTNVAFTISDGTTTSNISLSSNVTNIAGLVAAINGTLTTDGTDITAQDDGSGNLEFVSTATGAAAEVTIAGLSAGEITNLGAGLANGTTNGTAAATNSVSFNVTDGTTNTTVTLNTDLTNAAGVASAISTQLSTGGTAVSVTQNAGVLTFTSTATGSSANVQISSLSAGEATALGIANGTDDGADRNDTLSIVADDGTAQTVTLTAGTGRTAAQIEDDINAASLTDLTTARSGNNFTFTSSSLGASSSVALSGNFLTANTITATQTDGLANAGSEITTLSAGDLSINGVVITEARATDDTASDVTAATSNAAGSGIATAAAINRATDQTGVSARVNATVVTGGTSTSAATSGTSGTIYINNVATTTVTATGDLATDRGAAINAINAISGRTGVQASDNGASITLTAADGRNVSVAIDSTSSGFGAGIGLDSAQDGIAQANFAGSGTNYAATAETTYSTVTLSSARAIKIEGGNNGATGVSDIGFRQGTYGGATDGQFLTEVDISSLDGAQKALKALDNALDSVNRERANLGAIQNRLDSTISTLAINAENTSAANSRIRDADFAKESAELSRTQVLQQAGISILAQANAQPQLVLSLLR